MHIHSMQDSESGGGGALTDTDGHFHEVELTVLAAKGVAMPSRFLDLLPLPSVASSDSAAAASSAAAGDGGACVGASARLLGSGPGQEPNLCVIVIFNGDEVGRTGMVEGTHDPAWEGECFPIRVPGGEGLERAILRLDVFHLRYAYYSQPKRYPKTNPNLTLILIRTLTISAP